MKLTIALVTALIGAVTAIPTEVAPGITPVERGLDILNKRDCAPGNFRTCMSIGVGVKQCQCNSGYHCTCTWIENSSPGGNTGWAWWICNDCPKPPSGGLQCINGECNKR